jgi:hypothetical protein
MRDKWHKDAEYAEKIERPDYETWLKTWTPRVQDLPEPYLHPDAWVPDALLAYMQHPLENCTLLDVGGGNGVFSRGWWETRGASLTVFDIRYAIAQGTERRITDTVDNLENYFAPESVDFVQATEILEHMRKRQGERMLEKLKKIAKLGVLVTTPLAYQAQPIEAQGNPYQVHISGWLPQDLEKFGFHTIVMAANQLVGFWKR